MQLLVPAIVLSVDPITPRGGEVLVNAAFGRRENIAAMGAEPSASGLAGRLLLAGVGLGLANAASAWLVVSCSSALESSSNARPPARSRQDSTGSPSSPPLGGLRRAQRGESLAVVVGRPRPRQAVGEAQLAGGRREPVAGREAGVRAARLALAGRDDLARAVVVGERRLAVQAPHALEDHEGDGGWGRRMRASDHDGLRARFATVERRVH